MKFLSDPRVWQHSPLVTTILLQGANVGQLIRMWSERTAAGQSLWSWVYVNLALLLWFNWYRIFTPTQKIARYSCVFGILMNLSVIGTVVYFRYLI